MERKKRKLKLLTINGCQKRRKKCFILIFTPRSEPRKIYEKIILILVQEKVIKEERKNDKKHPSLKVANKMKVVFFTKTNDGKRKIP